MVNSSSQIPSKIRDFTDLVVWQKAHSVVLEIYKITKTFPAEEKFGLVSQMRRCATSMTANIAEGFGRQGRQEKTQFYIISRGSTVELQDHLLTARDLSYIPEGVCDELVNKAVTVNKLINGLIKSLREV